MGIASDGMDVDVDEEQRFLAAAHRFLSSLSFGNPLAPLPNSTRKLISILSFTTTTTTTNTNSSLLMLHIVTAQGTPSIKNPDSPAIEIIDGEEWLARMKRLNVIHGRALLLPSHSSTVSKTWFCPLQCH